MTRFEKNLDMLLPPPASEAPTQMTPKWGTVLSDGRVLLDHEGEALPATTPSLVHLYPGLRVAVDSYGHSKRIIGGLTTGGYISTSVNLNTLTQAGIYYVTNNGDASTGRNFPIAQAGFLRVNGIADGYAIQEYETWTPSGGVRRTFTRHLYSGSWRPWGEIEVWGPWTTLSLQNGWSATGSGPDAPAYRQSAMRVELKGAASPGTMNAAIATLPTDARPSAVRWLKPMSWTAQTSVWRLNVNTNGTIATQSADSTSWISFNGMIFSID